MPQDNFKVLDRTVYFIKRKKYGEDLENCGSDFDIVGFKDDVDTGEKYVQIRVHGVYGEENIITLNRATVNAKKLAEEINRAYGIVINAKKMFQFFNEKQSKLFRQQAFIKEKHPDSTIYEILGDLDGNSCKIEKDDKDNYGLKACSMERGKIYSDIGWKIEEGKPLTFQASKIYGSNDESEYKGQSLIQPKGDYKKIEDMFSRHVLNSTPLQVVSAIATSATLLPFVNFRWSMNIQNTVFSLAGTTTTGKTSASEFAVSFGGCPDKFTENSMLTDFQSTKNAAIKGCGNNRGYLIGIDDTKQADSSLQKSMGEFLYDLAAGTGRRRLGAFGKDFQKNDTFKTNVIISGEDSIFTFVDKAGGLLARVLEFSEISWMKDAKQAEEITSVVERNYGYITPMIAQYLLEIVDTDDEQKLKEDYYTWLKRFISEAKDAGKHIEITDRVSKTLALLMISLNVLSKTMNLDFSVEDVYEFLKNNLLFKLMEVTDTYNIGAKGYELLREFYIKNREKLYNKDEVALYGDNAANYMGAYIEKKDEVTFNIAGNSITSKICLGITALQAERILIKEGKLPNFQMVMTELRKCGALCTKSSKSYIKNQANKFLIGDEEVTSGYQIYMPPQVYQDYNDIDETTGEGKIKKIYGEE